MALDHIILWNCPIHAELEPEEVWQVSKLRDIIAYFEANREAVLESNPGKELDDVEITMGFARRPPEPRSLRSIREEWQRYAAIGETCCPECPVNYRRRLIGCFGAVNYPLTAEFEEWLMERYNPVEDLPNVVEEFILERGVEGDSLDARRGQEPEGPVGIVIRDEPVWKTLPDREEPLSSSVLLRALMHMGQIGADMNWSLLRSFGAVEGPPEVLAEIDRLVLWGRDDAPAGPERSMQLNRFTSIQADGDKMMFMTSDVPVALGKEENRERLKVLLRQTRFALAPSHADDRPTGGFKLFLAANYVALHNLAPLFTDG